MSLASDNVEYVCEVTQNFLRVAYAVEGNVTQQFRVLEMVKVEFCSKVDPRRPHIMLGIVYI